MSKTVVISIVLCVLFCIFGSDGRRDKKTFVPIHLEKNEIDRYSFVYEKHYISMRTGLGSHHLPVTCWLYNTTAEESQLVHDQTGLKLVELKMMQLATSQVGRVVSLTEAHATLHSLSPHLAKFCHTTANTTTIIWLDDHAQINQV
ncbi:uncharacterized protein [Magallana gigas]|uniref:uncharacterized protein n=1 Tax=Magallana gigas TaxID=29159 RepID=UPI00333EF27A